MDRLKYKGYTGSVEYSEEDVAEIAFSAGTTINEIIKRAVIKEIHTVEAG